MPPPESPSATPPPSSTSSMSPADAQSYQTKQDQANVAAPDHSMPLSRREIDKREADAILEELRRREDDEYLQAVYHYETDPEGRLKNLFWADADSGIDYLEHGDVVVIDNTYQTNKHGLTFVPFVGLNHHRAPAVFGCGVVSDRSLDSFVWLLQAFMLSTYQKRPKSVITDGGDAVVGAVRIVFPQSSHRICSWHTDQGIAEHLHCSSQNEFRSLMYDACSPAAFDARWHGFLARHRTAKNQRWLDAMYEKRELWAAAFLHGKFFLGMASDQRTECLATDLHTGLHEGMSLMDLFDHADACIDRFREEAAELDRKAAMSRVALTTKHRYLEEAAARSFTPANFFLLREEIKMIDDFEMVPETMAPVPGKTVYTVRLKRRRGVLFHVEWSDTGKKDDVKCGCRKMEREGLPCRHILRVMCHRYMSRVPECCALRRMRRRGDAKYQRLEEMEGLGRQVFDLASEDAQEFEEIRGFLERWLEQRQGSVAVAAEDDVVADEDGTPPAKKIKLFDE
ncbi:hypothetical protein ACP70R_004784 [Stipagrostis hirtigluma subsp. patula]